MRTRAAGRLSAAFSRRRAGLLVVLPLSGLLTVLLPGPSGATPSSSPAGSAVADPTTTVPTSVPTTTVPTSVPTTTVPTSVPTTTVPTSGPTTTVPTSGPPPTSPRPTSPTSTTAPRPTSRPSTTTAPPTRPTPAPSPAGNPADRPEVTQDTEPNQADLQAQQDLLRQLDLRIQSRQDAVSRARAELERAALVAGQALEAYSRATKTLQAAEREDQRRRDLLTRAQAALASSQLLLGRWVRQAYADGAELGGDLGLVSLLGAGSTDDVGATRQYLRRIGDSRSRTVTEVERAVELQAQASEQAQASAQAAAAAASAAQAAKAAADAAVKEQRDTLARLEQALAQSTAAAAGQRAQLAQARADFQAALRLSSVGAGRIGSNALTGAVGDCSGGDVQNYPNGQIPLAALCPLAADPSHHLRADAAFAFDRLSRAYVARFGAAPCLTDSYRSFDAQVRLYAIKPQLAARPGTSNHGWGTAVDLCGGIQSFDSPAHLWMQLNASLYGWFHPAWAQRGGSKPEPWHWEFGG